MRLVTYLENELPKLGAVNDDRVVDLARASSGRLPSTMIEFIEMGAQALDFARELVYGSDNPASVPLESVKLLAPIPVPRRNVMCVGWNYAEHFEEGLNKRGPSDAEQMPEYPTFFTKLTTTVVGPGEGVQFNRKISEQVDWEVELAVIIGRRGRNITQEEAMNYVFGYTIANDVSTRDLQRRHGGQWFRGKSLDTHCPMGPWIVTADEIEDPHNLRLSLKVNGVVKQDSSTKYMVFRIPRLIQELSLGSTLLPGDIILTGTPPGVGFARTPAEFLRPGDVMDLEIEKIGRLSNPVVEFND